MTNERTTQDDPALAATVANVTKITEAIIEVMKDQKMDDIYAALMYCLGRVIAAAHSPPHLLALTISKLAYAAKMECKEVNMEMDEDEEDTDDVSLTVN